MSKSVFKSKNLRLGFDFDLDSDLDILIAGWSLGIRHLDSFLRRAHAQNI